MPTMKCKYNFKIILKYIFLNFFDLKIQKILFSAEHEEFAVEPAMAVMTATDITAGPMMAETDTPIGPAMMAKFDDMVMEKVKKCLKI